MAVVPVQDCGCVIRGWGLGWQLHDPWRSQVWAGSAGTGFPAFSLSLLSSCPLAASWVLIMRLWQLGVLQRNQTRQNEAQYLGVGAFRDWAFLLRFCFVHLLMLTGPVNAFDDI